MTNKEFFNSLDFTNELSVITRIFERFPLQYGSTLGLDGKAEIRPLEFKFEKDGVLYFDTVKVYTSYREMLACPFIRICVCDQETMSYLKLEGKVCFTEDPEVIERCFAQSEALSLRWADHKELVIGYYLQDVKAEFVSFDPGLPHQIYQLPNRKEA